MNFIDYNDFTGFYIDIKNKTDITRGFIKWGDNKTFPSLIEDEYIFICIQDHRLVPRLLSTLDQEKQYCSERDYSNVELDARVCPTVEYPVRIYLVDNSDYVMGTTFKTKEDANNVLKQISENPFKETLVALGFREDY